MKKIIIAAITASAITAFFMMRRRKKSAPLQASMLTKRIGNEEKHLTKVFSKAKKNLMHEEVGENE